MIKGSFKVPSVTESLALNGLQINATYVIVYNLQ